MRRFGVAGCTSPLLRRSTAVSKRHASFKALIKEYGIPLAVYYFAFNEACVGVITYLLHTDRLGAGDIVSALEYVGLGSLIDVRSFGNSSTSLLGYEVSGRLVMNFGVASAVMSLFTPIQIPFCIATLPTILRWMGRKPSVVAVRPAAAATGTAEVGTAAASAVPFK